MDADLIILIAFIVLLLMIVPIILAPDESEVDNSNVVPLFSKRRPCKPHRWTKDNRGENVCEKCGVRPS